MSPNPTRRQLLAAGGLGVAALGGGALAYAGSRASNQGPTGSESPLQWIGDGMDSESESGYQRSFLCWSQPRYESRKADLPESAKQDWQDGSAYLPSDTFREAISVETAVFSNYSPGRGFATSGTVDVDTLVNAEFPAREILRGRGNDLDVAVEQRESHRGLDVYRQQFVSSGLSRAIAVNDSTCVVSNLYEESSKAVDTVKSIADNWFDGSQRLSETSDAFDRFTSLLDPGFVANISIGEAHTPRGTTIAFDGDTAVSREVVLEPKIQSNMCEERTVEQNIEGVMDQPMRNRFDSVSNVNVDISDGAGVVELSIPIEEVDPTWETLDFYRRGVFATCVD
ncbi:hypothetical protein SVXHr_0918 [Halorhabdus sp. SVX81]|nr:hypothetical protein SVXHr_0918 [Halorhabdus sp. SVX81]